MVARPDPKLQAQWDRKLRASGFHDVENRRTERLHKEPWGTPSELIHGAPPRPQHQGTRLSHRPSLVAKQASVEYWRMAAGFLHEHRFRRGERRIWRMHVEGMSQRRIAYRMHVGRKRIRIVIERLKARMLQGPPYGE